MKWNGYLTDSQILGVMSDEGRGLIRGCHWGPQTRFAVLDIDAGSKYHNAQELTKLQEKLAAVGLIETLYRSSESGGWHLYLFFDDWAASDEAEKTIKAYLKAEKYEIKGGQLEVFPGGNALRLPLQPGFAWLSTDGNLIRTRNEIGREEALSSFLFDLETSARNWNEAKIRIESRISEIDRAAGRDVQAHEERLDIEGFEHVLCRGKIQEIWEKGRKWWREGLQESGERHNAVLAVGHYLWYGDEDRSIAALPGTQNAEYRAHLIEAWLRKNHNGKCRHINHGNWEPVLEQIQRAAFWRRDKGPRQREHYPLTGRLLKRLVALYRKTKRIWSIEQFEKANQDKRLEARARIAEAIVSLEDEGQLITKAEVARRAKADWRTVKKNWDLMALVLVHPLEEKRTSETETNSALLACSGYVINSGGAGGRCSVIQNFEIVGDSKDLDSSVQNSNSMGRPELLSGSSSGLCTFQNLQNLVTDIVPEIQEGLTADFEPVHSVETSKDFIELRSEVQSTVSEPSKEIQGNSSSVVSVSAFPIGKTLFILPYGAKRRPQLVGTGIAKLSHVPAT